MPRPPWTPNAEQERLLAAAALARKKADAAEDAYRQVLAEAKEADVPISVLAERLKLERKTIYRHLGRTMR